MGEPWPLHRRVAKRAFDVIVSGCALAVLALPLVALALLVRATSKGPGLFLQERVGRRGRVFRIWKLRTMVAGTGSLVTAAGDPRVTPLGRFLRRTKLDELPQLWNVLAGDMSLVGPRPEVARYVVTYTAQQREVLAVRPGVTDPASIAFRNEEAVLAAALDREDTYINDVLPRKLALSRGYVRTQSFFGDLVLIARTAAVVLGRPGRTPQDEIKSVA
jgi:lipopolysaccharide/colanic/teichoic acid biosynthesis glycosyltransferase